MTLTESVDPYLNYALRQVSIAVSLAHTANNCITQHAATFSHSLCSVRETAAAVCAYHRFQLIGTFYFGTF